MQVRWRARAALRGGSSRSDGNDQALITPGRRSGGWPRRRSTPSTAACTSWSATGCAPTPVWSPTSSPRTAISAKCTRFPPPLPLRRLHPHPSPLLQPDTPLPTDRATTQMASQISCVHTTRLWPASYISSCTQQFEKPGGFHCLLARGTSMLGCRGSHALANMHVLAALAATWRRRTSRRDSNMQPDAHMTEPLQIAGSGPSQQSLCRALAVLSEWWTCKFLSGEQLIDLAGFHCAAVQAAAAPPAVHVPHQC